MRAARLLVLLTLAAVFAMHGLQCVSADPSGAHPADHSATAVGESMAVMAASAPLTSMSAEFVGLSGHAAASAVISGAPEAAADAQGSPSSQPRHGWTHVLAVCLAVLLAGLAVLVAASLLKTADPTGSREALLARARSWWAAIQLPRPPDLAVLCLLRI